ncbi:uncharacterized protein FTOL_13083 [Fusarium torulosum]|uniref:Uncharacterized protein n=1 Tax=Fusarium torulosum TaxID=33205 RepID=A0AAE8SPV0_9HYPO|nr:uncharacterized protein FTOL_13083 [Fusarium torulosum]
MNNIEYFPQFQDEFTELDFVDSNYSQDVFRTNFVDSSTVLPHQDIGQWLHLEPFTNEDASYFSFMDQAGSLDSGMDSMPQAADDLFTIDFSQLIAGPDLHLDPLDTALYDNSGFSNSFPDLPETLNETYLGDMSLSGSLDLNFTL